MTRPKTSLYDPKKIPQKPKEAPEAPQELTVIKIVYVYVPVPQEYIDDPLLDYKQVMLIMGWEKSKACEKMHLMTHYKDEKHLRVRRSWLNKWIDDHTEKPSD